MEWKELIVIDPKIAAGKPCIKGTRLSADFVLDLFGSGWSEAQVLENYPRLKPEHLRALFAYAAARVRDEEIFELGDGTSG